MQRYLGIDYGTSRIGLALSDDLGWMAHPFKTVTHHGSLTQTREVLLALIQEKNVTTIVIGLPKNMDGSEGESAQKVRTFAKALQEKTEIPIHFWDERLTTVAASRSLQAAGRNTQQQRKIIDQVAAQQILQGWMDRVSGV